MVNPDQKHSSIHHLEQAGQEVEEIGKQAYHKIAGWIKTHPILTLILSFLLSVTSNLVSQWIWDFFK